MTVASAIVVFVILWWLTFFCVLPIGIKPAEEGHLGYDAGAPANPRILRKMLITTGIAIVLFGVAYWIISSNFYSFRHKMR